jgi:hypothetical protein
MTETTRTPTATTAVTSIPFHAGREGYASFRIPAVVVTRTPTLPAAHSDLVRVDGATVGLLHETGDFGPYETITFRRIPVTALT